MEAIRKILTVIRQILIIYIKFAIVGVVVYHLMEWYVLRYGYSIETIVKNPKTGSGSEAEVNTEYE